MEIKLEQNTTPVTDIKPITAYRPQAVNESNACGYSLDIADKVMDNNAYTSQGKTMDDVMQGAKGSDAKSQKDLMVVMSNTVSEEDYKKMQEDGFKAGSTEVETYVSIIDKIKVTLAKSGVEVEGFTDNIDSKVATEILGNEATANMLLKSISQADLPVSMDTLTDFSKLQNKASEVEGLSDDALKYMIINKKEPSVDNLYMASFSSAKELKQGTGYFGETIGNCVSFYAKKAEAKSIININEQIEKVIDNSGLEVNEDTKEQAKWLVFSGIECNEENLKALSELQEIEFPISDESLINVTVEALRMGKPSGKVSLATNESIDKKAIRIEKEVNAITDAAIEKTIADKKPINIKNLYEAAKSEEEISQTKSVEALETRAKLEEIRLMMSVEANKELLKKGIEIDVRGLSELVDDLKQVINEMKSKLYKGDNVEENEQREEIYTSTIEKTEELKSFPVDFIGLHKDITTFNISKLHEEGRLIKREYEKLDKTYEEFLTKPRADLGDSIKKAFRNVDDILEDIGLEVNDTNRRAVRILGYNTMEVTPENIANVKEADQAVKQVIKRMNPATTLEMIRDGKNPLEMSIEEIDNYLNDKQDDQGQPEEKFSSFLQKLDKSKKITKEERKAYMGIYRMFRQIEKSDGAVIGSILKTKNDVNFKNMLTAVRINGKSINVQVDEEYGALEELIQKNSSISGDINQAFTNMGSEMSKEYYAKMSGEITRELAFNTKIDDLDNISVREETTIEGFYDELKKQSPLKEIEADTNVNYKEYTSKLQSAKDIEEAVIQKLIDLDLPISVDNLVATNELMAERGKLFNKIFKEETKTEADEELEEAKEDLVENFTDSKNAKKFYERLIDASRKKVHTLSDSSQNRLDIKAYQSICKTLSVANKLAKKESYEIPIEIDGEVTSINLEIYHDDKKRGMVTVTMETDKYGRLGASIQAKKGSVNGMLVYENKFLNNDLRIIKEKFENNIYEAFGKDAMVNLSLVQTKEIDLKSFAENRDIDSALPTKDLYTIAKSFLSAVQTKE